jgi:L,D-transpeptidase catalytic domain
MHDHSRSGWLCRHAAAKAAVAMPVIALTAAVLITGCGTAGPQHANGPPQAGLQPRGTVQLPASGAPHPATELHVTGTPRTTVQTAAIERSQGTGAPDAAEVADLTGAARTTGSPQASAQPGLLQARRSAAPRTARLAMATTYGTTPAAPQDPAPFKPETGIVLHPTATRVIYARPGGPAVGALPATELGSPTWVPVIQSKPGWDRVLLPTRPNHSTGWIYLGGGGLQTAYTPYQVNISLSRHQLTLIDAGHRLGTWTVAEGAPGTPTPTGRTFVLASLVPRQPAYTPLILPLGVHSSTLSAYGGGPGTVGLHGWPDSAVFGHSVSHGCVRVPAAALRALSRVPLGSAVMITS